VATSAPTAESILPLWNSWTLSLLRQLWPRMTLLSIIRYRAFLLREAADTMRASHSVRLRLRAPYDAAIRLQETGSDMPTFREVLMGDEVYRCVVDRLPGCRTVVDLGANIGLATIYFAAHYPGSRILAVEPNPVTFRELERNVRHLSRADRIHLVWGGVWSDRRTLAPHPAPATTKSNAFATLAADDAADEVIPGYPMTQLIDMGGFDSVDLVKVDIEGAEVELFRGDLSWLERVRMIAIEFHGNSRSDSGFDGIMRGHGFMVDDTNRHTVIAQR